MTPRDVLQDEAVAPGKPFSSRDLVLHGRPNWLAGAFFCLMAGFHIYIAVHAFGSNTSEAVISSSLAACFLFVANLCILTRHQIAICPTAREIRIERRYGRFIFDRELPFSCVRAVRVTLWQSRRGPQSRLEILCHGEELPCPPTNIPRQEALYLALVMNVRLIKVSSDRADNALANGRSW
jgi:hypothetical protein